MEAEVIEQWREIVYGILFIGFLVNIHFAMVRYAARPLSDCEYLSELSAAVECSERGLFLLGAEDWHVSESTVEGDFKDYVLNGELPYYMRDFVRRFRDDPANRCLQGGACSLTCPLWQPELRRRQI
jgi:hypothetical protein